MLRPASLLRILVELVLALLGLLLVAVAVTGRFGLDRRSPYWLVLGVFLIYMGLRAWMRASRPTPRWEERLRGASLALVGALMLGMVRAPWTWVAPLLATAGAILALRGLMSIAAIVRSSPGSPGDLHSN